VVIFSVVVYAVGNLDWSRITLLASQFLSAYGMLLMTASAVLVAVRIASSPPRVY
jgi:hypothetical protein